MVQWKDSGGSWKENDTMANASTVVKSSCLWSKTIYITTTIRDTREDSEYWLRWRSTIHIFSQHKTGEEILYSSLAKPETHLSLQTLWNSVCSPQKTTSNNYCYWLPKSFDFSLSSWRVAVQYGSEVFFCCCATTRRRWWPCGSIAACIACI